MLAAAYASFRHWSTAGGPLEAQRARHLLATVHAYLGHGELALAQGLACAELSGQNGDEQTPFDRASALECLARAHACVGLPEAGKLRADAERAGGEIPAVEDRQVFVRMLGCGPWYALEDRAPRE